MKKKNFFGLNGKEPREKRNTFFAETDGLNLLKDAIVKRKLISLSEVMSFYSFY
jgi:hypothetical protein